ncbi:TPA: transcriptional regulator [Enterobacter hormaechei]
MRYLINDLIIYDVTLKTLSNRNFEEDSIELNPGSVAVLLDFFISYPHKVWTKPEIGEMAFLSSPYSGTESNVNKSLSLLRRSFKEVGEDSNIISTISNSGVVFNASVVPYEDAPVGSTKTNSKRALLTKKYKTKTIVLGVLLLSILSYSILVYISNSQIPSECNFLIKGDQKEFVSYVANIKAFKNCKAPGIIISSVRKKSSYKKNYSLAAKCDAESSSCLNYIQK